MLNKNHIAIRLAALYRKCQNNGLTPIEFYLTTQDSNDYLEHLNAYIEDMNEFSKEYIEPMNQDKLKISSWYLGAIFKDLNSQETYIVGIDNHKKMIKVLEDE